MKHRFTTVQWLPFPPGLVFAFLADPANLPPLMPAWQHTRIETAQIVPPPDPRPVPASSGRFRSIAAGKGSTMLISFRPFPLSPIRVSWNARIDSFAWNDHFCDEQQSGPFASWRHCHRLRDEAHLGVQGTLVIDEVHYEMKMGRAGDLVHALLIDGHMQMLFRYRQKRLPKLLERAGGLMPRP